MTHVHYVAGRLRLKFAKLKNQQELARTLEQTICCLDGITLVQTNTITGSLLVHYDVRGKDEQALLCAIEQVNRQYGLTSASWFQAANAVPGPLRTSHENEMVGALIGLVIEKVLERSALALVGALL